VIEDYISDCRFEVTDDNGREPILTSKQDRVARTTIQKNIYTATRSCTYNGGNCPFGEDTDSCEALAYDQANKCPGSVRPHAL